MSVPRRAYHGGVWGSDLDRAVAVEWWDRSRRTASASRDSRVGCATASGPAGVSHAAPDPSAVQSIYLSGVPHTDAQGRLRSAYDSASFFPRCIYHAMPGSFAAIKTAGFNCVHTWEGVGVADVIDELHSSGCS